MSSPFAKKFCGKKSALTYGKGPLKKIKDGVTGVGNSTDSMSPGDKKAVIMTYKQNVKDFIAKGGTKSEYNNSHWNEVQAVHKATAKP